MLPDCEIYLSGTFYSLAEIGRGKTVLDIGCGHGFNKEVIEAAGGRWIGIDPFRGGGQSAIADAMFLPIMERSIDVVVADSVLEHIPNLSRAFAEIARVLKPGGKFVGYAAFLEPYHEISYCHVSYSALEYFALESGMKLRKLFGGGRYGIGVQIASLIWPLRIPFLQTLVSALINTLLRFKLVFGFFYLILRRRQELSDAWKKAKQYYVSQKLGYSQGFSFLIDKR
ncbi:MAG TPA: methyltransferase domain-containing protein [Bdellovibrionota bacterium]|nr:methyltransferase domain-containing protein [Bdellovibrionota bacterium]